jgi:hypothetical protein
MKTQIKPGGMEVAMPLDTPREYEIIAGHPEIDRVELMATVTDDDFKNALMMINTNMMETGKANAFAVYKTPEKIEISDPVLAESEYVCRYGEDPTKCIWHEEVKIDELLRDDSPKKQSLLCARDDELCETVPRKDVWAYIVGLPMGKLDRKGLTADDIRRPTLDFLDLYLQQERLHPGFILGILTNDGNKSGILLLKKNEKADHIESRSWGNLGKGDEVSRELILGAMDSAGIAYADIDLSCPKNRDSGKLYNQRIEKAVNKIF